MNKYADKSDIPDDAATTEATELDELRTLLLPHERHRINRLEQRLDSSKTRADELANVLPDAVRLSSSKNSALNRALEPSIEAGLTASIKKDPKALADVLFPIMGPAIRKSITSTLHAMTQAVNKAVEHSISIQGIKWRLEAARSKQSFAEIVLLNTLEYQVEQIFLIHRKTGLVLHHVVAPEVISEDPDLVSSMLTAIQDFISDSFAAETEEDLDAIRMGAGRTVWLDSGTDALLATVIRGTPPMDLRISLSDMLGEIHQRYAAILDSFDGDVAPFEAVHDELQNCLISEFKKKEKQSSLFLWFLTGGLALGLGFLLFSLYSQRSNWNSTIELLHRTPGIVITESRKISGQYHIYGFRDGLAPRPEELMMRTPLDSSSVAFHLEPYISLHPDFTLARAETILQPPKTVTLEMKEGKLSLQGSATFAWIEQSRTKASLFPGITGYDDSRIISVNSALNPPQTVTISIEDDTLFVRGSASAAWIRQARTAGDSLPGVSRYDDNALLDIDSTLNPPQTVALRTEGSTLHLRGTASTDWIKAAMAQAASFAGVDKLDDTGLVDIDIALKPPETVTLEIKGKNLFARGSASADWARQARAAASSLPGIVEYNDQELVGVDGTLTPPATVIVELKDKTLHARGAAFLDWIEAARVQAASFPGVDKFDDTELIDIGEALKPPETVTLEIKGKNLFATGTAAQAWIRKARTAAASLPGVNSYNDRELVDIDVLLKPPKTVTLSVTDMTLTARGAAFGDWIEKTRAQAVSIPGIEKFNDSQLIDVNKMLKPPGTVALEIKGNTLYARGSAFLDWISQAKLAAASLPAPVRYNDRKLLGIDETLNPPTTVTLAIKGNMLLAQGSAFDDWIVQARTAAASLPGDIRYDDKALVNINTTLNPPESVRLNIETGTLFARGAALNSWIRQAAEKAVSLPGITSYSETDLINIEENLKPPADVTLRIDGNTLYLSGSASRQWISQLETEADSLPTIDHFDLTNLVDLNELKRLKENVESQVFTYHLNSHQLDKVQEREIRMLAEDLERISAMAQTMKKKAGLRVVWHSTSFGWGNRQQQLGQKRAEYLLQRLVTHGLVKENYNISLVDAEPAGGKGVEQSFVQLKITIDGD
ncbi:MAG: hypothetical protein ABFS19_00210 [Thermodesulfobacteriota bacterium]